MSKLLFKIAKFVASNDLFPLEPRARAAEYLAQKVEDPIQRAEYLASASECRHEEMCRRIREAWNNGGNYQHITKDDAIEVYRVEGCKYRAQATKDPKEAAKYLAMSFSNLAIIARGLAENVRSPVDFPDDKASLLKDLLIHQPNRSVGANEEAEKCGVFEVEYRVQEAEARVLQAGYEVQAAKNSVEMTEWRAFLYGSRSQLIRWQRRADRCEYGSIQAAEYDNREAEEHTQEAKYWAEAFQYFYTGSMAKYYPRNPYETFSRAREWEKEAGKRVERTKYLAKRATELIEVAEKYATRSDKPILALRWRAQVYEYQAQAAQYRAHEAEYCEQVIRLNACREEDYPEKQKYNWEYRSYRALTEEVRTEVDEVRCRYVFHYSQAANYRAEAEKVYRKRLILILQGEIDRIKKAKLPICSDRCFTVMGRVLEYLRFVDEQTKQTNVQIK
jgi:hypothetical protein